LEVKQLGLGNGSIGIYTKGGILIDGKFIAFGNADVLLRKYDFVGIGIIQHPNSKMECFATLNDKFLGKINKIIEKKNLKIT